MKVAMRSHPNLGHASFENALRVFDHVLRADRSICPVINNPEAKKSNISENRRLVEIGTRVLHT